MFQILGVAIQAKNDADCVVMLLCCEKTHDIEKSTLVRLCSLLFQDKETLVGSIKEPRALLKSYSVDRQ